MGVMKPLFRFMRRDGRIHEVYVPSTLNEAALAQMSLATAPDWFWNAGQPNPAQILCPVHVK